MVGSNMAKASIGRENLLSSSMDTSLASLLQMQCNKLSDAPAPRLLCNGSLYHEMRIERNHQPLQLLWSEYFITIAEKETEKAP